MATSTTSTGKSIESFIQGALQRADDAAKAAIAAGYPPESAYTQAYYSGIPSLYMYGDAEQQQALERAGGLYGLYGQAGQYTQTPFADLEARYGVSGRYDPTQYEMADYTARNIQQRMSPYEELVSRRQGERLKQAYDEARGEREAQAVRAGAFGGSGQAIQEEMARREYMRQLADMNAQNLQAAFESGSGLYSKEMADRLAAQQATEASRQFGKQTEMAGLEGMMGARQQTAAQIAAAKEAELAGLGGQAQATQQQASMAEQRKNMQLANLAAQQAAGQQKEERQLAQAQYPLGIAGMQANVLSPLSGGTTPVATSTQKTSTLQNILGGLSTAAGVVSGLGGLFGAGGGIVPDGLQHRYRGGGLADLEPQYYDSYER